MTRTISIFFKRKERREELHKAHQKPPLKKSDTITTLNILEWLKSKKLKITNAGKNMERLGPGTLVHCWWECKTVRLLWKTA